MIPFIFFYGAGDITMSRQPPRRQIYIFQASQLTTSRVASGRFKASDIKIRVKNYNVVHQIQPYSFVCQIENTEMISALVWKVFEMLPTIGVDKNIFTGFFFIGFRYHCSIPFTIFLSFSSLRNLNGKLFSQQFHDV